jgi:hypothetical protein
MGIRDRAVLMSEEGVQEQELCLAVNGLSKRIDLLEIFRFGIFTEDRPLDKCLPHLKQQTQENSLLLKAVEAEAVFPIYKLPLLCSRQPILGAPLNRSFGWDKGIPCLPSMGVIDEVQQGEQ